MRGLSTLLILEELMALINKSLRDSQGYAGNDLEARDIFQFAGGTSTGGLIAIMLTRLRMSIGDCIVEYRKLSREVFKRKHMRGKFSGGLWKPRYHGSALRNCVRKLLLECKMSEDEKLNWKEEDLHTQRMHWLYTAWQRISYISYKC